MIDDYKHEDDDDKDDDKEEIFKRGSGVARPPTPIRLAETITLDPSVAGRTKFPLSADVLHDLAKPTLLVPAPEVPQSSSSTMTTNTTPR